MLLYYLDLARRSLRRNVGLTILMVIAIAFGIGATMTTLTVLHVLSADPIPGASGALYYVQLDPRPAKGYTPGEEPDDQVTRSDAEALVRAARADHQAMMAGGEVAVEPRRAGLAPFASETRYTSAEFFAMFRVPFVAGTGWSSDDDGHAARVAVISRALADKLFGELGVVGRTVRVEGNDLRIVGVLDTWRPIPHFYDLYTGAYANSEQLYTPFSTSRELKLARSGTTNCWKETAQSDAVGAPCTWIQLWVELGDRAKVAAYRDFLNSYSQDQKQAGRFERPPNIQLRNVAEWLAHKEVVPRDVHLQTWIALGFLVVCLVNTVGLLLTKFLHRSVEIGVRRALGASRRAIFVQLLVEAGTIGLTGGLLGLVLAWLGLWAVRQQPTAYAELSRLDLPMLVATFVLAVASSMLAGLLPAWRGCQVAPAIQLKSE